MEKIISKGLLSILTLSIAFTSCKKEDKYTYLVGNPTVTVKSDHQNAFFGDSITFTVQVADNEIALSTVKAQLYYTDDMVSETVIRTKENGEYMGKIYVPFYRNVPDGTATLKFVVQNISKKSSEQEFDIELSRPDYPYLTLVTANAEHRMDRVGRNQYEATETFPFSLKGYIKAPKYGTDGNELTFGWSNNAIDLGNTNDIPFSYSNSGVYTISFNTLTYEAAPFIIAYAINGTVFSRIDDNHFKAELNFTQGETVTIDGFEDLESWWIDSDFFAQAGNGDITFNAVSGKYRVTADLSKKYFTVSRMTGANDAELGNDGHGALWLMGWGVGSPSLDSQFGWNPGGAYCVAEVSSKKYRFTGIAGPEHGSLTGQRFRMDYLDYKLFFQNGWGGEFSSMTLAPGSENLIKFSGTNIQLADGVTLDEGATYVLTVEVLTVFNSGSDRRGTGIVSFEKL